MDKFRVAICISGQARHWRVASKNIKKYFESNIKHKIFDVPIEYDYFIHTWDTNTWRYPKTHHTFFYDEKHNDKDEIEKEFNPKYFELEEWIPKKFIRAWDALFYSFYRSLMLKRQYEIENNFEYDLVVLTKKVNPFFKRSSPRSSNFSMIIPFSDIAFFWKSLLPL